jgi:TRAP-type uncharacterized transport system substrate-binding protein
MRGVIRLIDLFVLSLLALALQAGACGSICAAQETLEVGETGFDVKRPVLAAACEKGCPWGELADFVKEAMTPLGYEVIICRNCNRTEGPRIVGKASYPPEIGVSDLFVGTTVRVNAPVDFGITESGFLAWAFRGKLTYSADGPYPNLRLVAKIEDPTYLLVAVKADSGITDLAQIAAQQRPVRILGGDAPGSQAVLAYYGLTQDAVAAWGGSFGNPIVEGAGASFDVIVSDLASPANNLESSYWTALSQKYDLHFLDLPDELLDKLVNDPDLGVQRVTAKYGLLRGVDRPIATVARSGEAVFARDDTPEQAAYDIAKAIDEQHAGLKWYIRPYSYDAQSAWQNFDVPLHPGAARYYRERGYMPADDVEEDAGSADVCSAASERTKADAGCSTAPGRAARPHAWLLALCAGAAVRRWRKRRPRRDAHSQ